MTVTQLLLFVLPLLIIALVLYLKHKRSHPEHLELGERERRLHQQVFSELSVEQFSTLIALATWREVNAGEVVIERGGQVDCLSLVSSGSLRADLGKNVEAVIRTGQFIGEMSYVSGNPGSVNVTAIEDSVLAQWPQKQLKALLIENNAISSCLQSLFQRDLINKLER